LTRAIRGNFILYHGTSSEDWEKIKTKGLVPLFHGSNQKGGFESREKHPENTKVLYLASSKDTALHYAKARCSSLKIQAKREGKNTMDDYGGHGVHIDGVHVYPVVLEVHVPDVARLVADDDYVNEMARALSRKIWSEKEDQEKKAILEKLKASRTDLSPDWRNWHDPLVQQMLWRETDEGFKEIMSHIPKERYTQWFESLKQSKQVGYRGIIPPKFLKLLPIKK
jgi:hypothetical protein